MRRLWANILIACAGILTVFAATPGTIKQVKTNGDFKYQREFTFQLTERESEDGITTKELDSNSAKEMAKTMEARLIASKITAYEISTLGNDMVTVTFAADSETAYSQVTTYLSFSGSFALVNTQDSLVIADEFLNGHAYLKSASIDEYPTVIIPIKTNSSNYENLITQAREHPEAGETDEEGNEGEETAPIYMLYNYVEGDTYTNLNESGKFSEKTLLTFNAMTDENLYYEGKNENGVAAFAQICGFSDSNGNGVADPNEVSAAFAQADYLVNLLNASALDFDVKVIKGEEKIKLVEPNVEFIMGLNTIQFNATLISIVVAIVVIALLLIVFYRLGAMNIMTTTLVGTFLTFLFITLMGLEYNTLCIVGYILVALISIVSGIIYCSKLKDEAYKGRSLKKANSEASRKSLLPIVDINIVGLIVGLMIFLMGGQALHAFGSILTLGSLISLVFSTLGLKGLMWLATNTTALTGKYEAFGINAENVPNHMAEEKQRYFGSYADKDLSAKKKPVSIAGAAVFVAALVGIIVSASLNSGNLFKQQQSKVTGSEIYVTSTYKVEGQKVESNLNSEDILEDIFKDILIYQEGEDIPTTVDNAETDPHLLANYLTTDLTQESGFTISETKYENDVSKTYNTIYFECNLKSYINGDKVRAKVISSGTTYNTLNEAFLEIADTFVTGETVNISLKEINTVPNVPGTDWTKMSLAIFVAILILTLYFMLRYRLSRGLAMLIYPFASAGIALGVFVLLSACGLTMPVNIVISIPVILILTYTYMIMFASKERDLLSEDKVKDNTLEHRTEISKRAMGIALTPILCVVAVSIYLLINFFGFAPAVNSFAYLAGIIGMLVALGLVVITYPALSNLLFKWFSRVHVSKKPRKAKKNIQVVKKSAEPEEAIFIGIND